METLFLEEKNTTSLLPTIMIDDGFQVSSIFHKSSPRVVVWESVQIKDSPFLKNELIGTTISTLRQETRTKTEEDNYEIGYYNDDYDIVAAAPIKQSFKVKVKIKSITKLQPKAFIDFE